MGGGQYHCLPLLLSSAFSAVVSASSLLFLSPPHHVMYAPWCPDHPLVSRLRRLQVVLRNPRQRPHPSCFHFWSSPNRSGLFEPCCQLSQLCSSNVGLTAILASHMKDDSSTAPVSMAASFSASCVHRSQKCRPWRFGSNVPALALAAFIVFSAARVSTASKSFLFGDSNASSSTVKSQPPGFFWKSSRRCSPG